MKKIFLIVMTMTVVNISLSQEVLTLEEAISRALENNYDVKLEKYNTQVSENNVSRAVAGQLPRVELTANYELGYATAETQTLGTTPGEPSPPIELEGTSQDLSFKNQMTVPIFTGFKGKYSYKQLQNASRLSQLQLQSVLEQTIANTTLSYLQVARQQSSIHILEETINLSYDQWQRVQADKVYGNANSIRVLQTEVNLKTDSANYRSALLNLENSLRDLNLMMGVSLDEQYTVEESITLSGDLSLEQLQASMIANNTRLLVSRKGLDNAQYDLKISKSSQMPQLNGYANMSYLDTEDEASFIRSNNVFGPNVGVSLSFPIMTSGANRIQRQNSKIKLEQQKVTVESTEYQLNKELRNTYATYLNGKSQLRIEGANLQTFIANYEKSVNDLSLGQISRSDVRTAQLNLASAKNRINDLTYNVKQSEIQLLNLSGELQMTNQ